jgi:thiosulfate/3-mercaptopyruvate sulfurtransferase
LEAWEKVLLDLSGYENTTHAQIACTSCHGGTNDPEKEIAHTDLIPDPSEDPGRSCGECHPDLIEPQLESLHYTLAGYDATLAARSEPDDPETWAHIQEMQGNHCDSCHATCGQCHISQPASVGGGLLDGHNYLGTPPMSRTCTACHGSRVGNEYLGKNEGFLADIHFRQGRMACVDCHDGMEMHGQQADCLACHPGKPPSGTMSAREHRYQGLQSPRCETCHPSVTSGLDGIEMHQVHGGGLSCQVCHSVSYKNCDACHTQLNEEGVPFFETEASYMGFFIGKNPRKSFDRPYDFVPLRHVPIARDSFETYGENLLPNFDALPTWRYATPHNIQLLTPQNQSCDSCHGNPEIFLTADQVAEEEFEANRDLIVIDIPRPIEEVEE